MNFIAHFFAYKGKLDITIDAAERYQERRLENHAPDPICDEANPCERCAPLIKRQQKLIDDMVASTPRWLMTTAKVSYYVRLGPLWDRLKAQRRLG